VWGGKKGEWEDRKRRSSGQVQRRIGCKNLKATLERETKWDEKGVWTAEKKEKRKALRVILIWQPNQVGQGLRRIMVTKNETYEEASSRKKRFDI